MWDAWRTRPTPLTASSPRQSHRRGLWRATRRYLARQQDWARGHLNPRLSYRTAIAAEVDKPGCRNPTHEPVRLLRSHARLRHTGAFPMASAITERLGAVRRGPEPLAFRVRPPAEPMPIHATLSEVLLDDLKCGIGRNPVDLFVTDEHEIDEMQNASDVRQAFCERHHGPVGQRVDDIKPRWHRRSGVTETLDQVCEVLGQHVVVRRPDEGVLGRMSG